MMRATLIGALLGASLCWAGCYRTNPRYCDDQIRCPTGAVCGPLHECVPAATGDPDLSAPRVDDLRASEPPEDAMQPNPCPTCTCRPDNLPGCSCQMMGSCSLSCGDECVSPLHCQMVTNCTITAGTNADISCAHATSCILSAGAGSVVRCSQFTTCVVTCTGGSTKMDCGNGVYTCSRSCP